MDFAIEACHGQPLLGRTNLLPVQTDFSGSRQSNLVIHFWNAQRSDITLEIVQMDLASGGETRSTIEVGRSSHCRLGIRPACSLKIQISLRGSEKCIAETDARFPVTFGARVIAPDWSPTFFGGHRCYLVSTRNILASDRQTPTVSQVALNA